MKLKYLTPTIEEAHLSVGVEATLTLFLEDKSESTKRLYTRVFHMWAEFLMDSIQRIDMDKAVLRATPLHTSAFFARRGKETTLNTLKTEYAALCSIYKGLERHGYQLMHHPMAGEPPKFKPMKEGRDTDMIPFAHVKALLDAPHGSDREAVRDRAILAIFLGGGLRRDEVQKLTIGDVRITSKDSTFLLLKATKAGTDAKQAVPEWAADKIKALRELRIEEGGKSCDPLFMNYRGYAGKLTPMSSSTIYRLFKRYVAEAGIPNPESLSPHSARRTAITRLLDKGMNHRKVQEFSRHASVVMVEKYDKRRTEIDESAAKELDYE